MAEMIRATTTRINGSKIFPIQLDIWIAVSWLIVVITILGLGICSI